MTNEQRETIDRLERYLIADKINLYTTVRTDDLDTVLSLIKEQQEEIEGVKDKEVLIKRYFKKCDLIKQKDKQIDLMADNIELQQYANIDTSDLDLICESLNCNKKCELIKKDCIKQYFERKVEDDKD